MRALYNGASIKEAARLRGVARVDERTKRLALRILPGEIAVINHLDLDLPCSQALIARRPAAVVNAQPSISGRFPNLGPSLLIEAGIPLLDNVGAEIMQAVADGEEVEIVGESLFVSGRLISRGERLNADSLAEKMERARANLGEQLGRFVRNTLTYISDEQRLLYDPSDIPGLRTHIQGRHVLVAVRGEDAAADLRTIRSYIRDRRPVLIAVDGGADLLLSEGLTPDMIIGDMDSVSDEALRCGAELVVHAYSSGSLGGSRQAEAPGLNRLKQMGLEAKVFSSLGTSEDIALLLAYEKGAELIVAVGAHFSLREFLEKARGGMASTFLVRLKVGELLVDAKGLSRLYPTPLPFGYLAAISGAALLAAVLLAAFAPQVRAGLEMLLLRLRSLF
jgi:uncharacterized membrane-anchored protein